MPSLGSKIRQLRRFRGLTQQQLAQEAAVSLSTVSKIEESAVTRPSAKVLMKLIKVLDYDLDNLLSADPLPAHMRKATRTSHSESKAGIKFVYFDVGGVLMHTEARLMHALSASYHRPIDQVRAVYWQLIPMAARGKLTLQDLQVLFLLRLNIKLKVDKRHILFKHWVDYMEAVPETQKFMKEVMATYPIGLLTNMVQGFLDRMFERKLLPKLAYKTIVDSSVVGIDKPWPDIYQIAQDKAGVEPSEILFIDDRQLNVEAARQMGWQAEWFDELNPQASIDRIRAKYF